MDKPYEYCGIEASSYDLIDELSDFDDYPFYRFLIESNPGQVLDLGCGTGRILCPLARDGISVTGIDSSHEMLEICQEKLSRSGLEAKLSLGDMRKFDLSSQFDSILIPGFTFNLFLDTHEIEGCLDACFKHLKTSGQLVLPTYIPWEMLEGEPNQKPLKKRSESSSDQNGSRIVAWQGWEINRFDQLLRLRNRFQHLDFNGIVQSEEDRTMALRWHLPYDMLTLLRKCGFGDVSVYGDFTFDPPESDSESVIYVARR